LAVPLAWLSALALLRHFMQLRRQGRRYHPAGDFVGIGFPNVLWPPNHKMTPVTVAISASDVCSPTVTCKITSVTSNEPVNAPGSGNTAPDWQITGDRSVNLRAERSGSGNGRVYTLTVQCTDASNNSSSAQTTV
jgi:hypothetical protein